MNKSTRKTSQEIVQQKAIWTTQTIQRTSRKKASQQSRQQTNQKQHRPKHTGVIKKNQSINKNSPTSLCFPYVDTAYKYVLISKYLTVSYKILES